MGARLRFPPKAGTPSTSVFPLVCLAASCFGCLGRLFPMSKPLSLFDHVGGSQGLERLVTAFLEALCSEPSVLELRNHYPQDLSHYRTRMLEYLSGFLGGPALYCENHGLPLLREQHLMMRITAPMRDQWFCCMQQAVNRTFGNDPSLCEELLSVFWSLVDSLKNA